MSEAVKAFGKKRNKTYKATLENKRQFQQKYEAKSARGGGKMKNIVLSGLRSFKYGLFFPHI